jgi:hypothetical protein
MAGSSLIGTENPFPNHSFGDQFIVCRSPAHDGKAMFSAGNPFVAMPVLSTHQLTLSLAAGTLFVEAIEPRWRYQTAWQSAGEIPPRILRYEKHWYARRFAAIYTAHYRQPCTSFNRAVRYIHKLHRALETRL